MHLAQNAADLALTGKNGEESLLRDTRVLECTVYKAKSATDGIAQLGAEIELADLGMMERPNEPVRIIGKCIP